MFQLSKKVEYALFAIKHMAAGDRGKIYTTKEISEKYQLPHELLAKIMQILVKHHFISSYQGVNGGYVLARNPSEIKVSEIISAVEGKSSVTILSCETGNPDDCTIHTTCTIKNPLVKLQNNINKVLEELTVTEMFS